MGNDSSEERGGVALVRGTKGMREGGREKNGRGGDHEVLWEGRMARDAVTTCATRRSHVAGRTTIASQGNDV
jgi:hypothetical protein